MLNILFNGKIVETQQPVSVIDFLSQHADTNDSYTLLYNQRFLAKENYHLVLLQDQDTLDIFIPLEGG